MAEEMGHGKKSRGRRKVAEKKTLFLLRIIIIFFLLGFATNPFSTTSRALAHKGAETRTW